ncbi:MAG: CheR family methyltransferase [Janthinobacterium lividum]
MNATVPASTSNRSANGASCSPRSYAFLQQLIYTESGIVLDSDKQYLMETRLLPVAKKHGIETLDGLSAALASRTPPALKSEVIDAMTTNETLFFRDPSLFDALKSTVFPELFGARGTRRLRIWSAAASSGQEAYTLAMLMLDMGRSSADVEIVGTDLATHVLERARTGRYGQFEVGRGLPGNYLMKYFARSGMEWEVKSSVKSLVRFQQLDLRKDLRHMGTFDLILCRNVLIYFDSATKSSILGALRQQLAPSGMLALGCAETIMGLHSGYRRKAVQQAALYTRNEEN